MGYILGCMCTYLYVLCSTDAIADRKHSLVCVFVVTAVDNGASSVVVSATVVLLAAALGLLISV